MMESKTILQAGFGKVCINPEEPMPLGGYGNVMTRISNNVLSDIFSICIALRDNEGNTVLLIENDMIKSGEEVSVPARKAIEAETGIPFSHIMVCATHTHSAPEYRVFDEPCCKRFIAFLTKKVTEAAKAALADLKPATMEAGEGKTEHLNFVRHYVLEDGSYKGDNFGDLNKSPYAGHTTEADPTMRVVRFVREGAKDIVLVNWQSHPHRTGGSKKYDISADIIGVLRDELDAAKDCHTIYFTGGAGNINPTSRIKEENIYADYLESGKALARHATEIMEHLEPVASGSIKVKENLHMEPTDVPTPEKAAKAKELIKMWREDGMSYWDLLPYCNEAGFNSIYTADSLLGKLRLGSVMLSVPLYAISFGDVAFATAPYEMFDTNAKYVRDFSPFKMTIVASCANDDNSYVPSAYGYFHGCYETDCAHFKPGAGEVFAQKLVKMLRELK